MRTNFVQRVALIASILLSPFFKSFYTTFSTQETWAQALVILANLVLIILILFEEFGNKIFQNLQTRYQKVYSNFIYERIDANIEYLDKDGSSVSCYREDRIRKLSFKKSDNEKKVPLRISKGVIDNDTFGGLNCNVRSVDDQEINFVSNLQKGRMNNKIHVANYSVVLKDAFPANSTFWIISPENYCHICKFRIVLHPEVKVSKASLYHRIELKDDNFKSIEEERMADDWDKVSRAPMRSIENGRHIITVQLHKVAVEDSFKIEWETENIEKSS